MAFAAAGLVSCSSSTSETGIDPEPTGANQVNIQKDGSNNPFAFNKDDVNKAKDGRVTGGKRSQFELKADSAYAKANADASGYLKRSYHKQSWSGARDFSTGSYETGSYGKSKSKSWFSIRRSKNDGRMASAAGRDFSTGSYRTGSANEQGKVRPTGSSAYVDEQVSDGWRKIQILENKQYRKLTMGQAKSLLGR